MRSQEEHNKDIVRRAFAAIETGRYDELDQYISVDYVRHCQATPETTVNSLVDFIAVLGEWGSSFSDIENRLDRMIAEDDYVAFVGCFSGTQTGPIGPFPATGKRMDSEFAGYHRLADGKIVETWVTWDNLVALQQLGHFPPPGAGD